MLEEDRSLVCDIVFELEDFISFCSMNGFDRNEIKEARVFIGENCFAFKCNTYAFKFTILGEDAVAFCIDDGNVDKPIQIMRLNECVENYDDCIVYKHIKEPGCELKIFDRIHELCKLNKEVYLGECNEKWLISGLQETEQMEMIIDYIRG